MHRGANTHQSCCTLSVCPAGAAAVRPRNPGELSRPRLPHSQSSPSSARRPGSRGSPTPAPRQHRRSESAPPPLSAAFSPTSGPWRWTGANASSQSMSSSASSPCEDSKHEQNSGRLGPAVARLVYHPRSLPASGRSAHMKEASARSRRTSTRIRCRHRREAGSGGPRRYGPSSSGRARPEPHKPVLILLIRAIRPGPSVIPADLRRLPRSGAISREAAGLRFSIGI